MILRRYPDATRAGILRRQDCFVAPLCWTSLLSPRTAIRVSELLRICEHEVWLPGLGFGGLDCEDDDGASAGEGGSCSWGESRCCTSAGGSAVRARSGVACGAGRGVEESALADAVDPVEWQQASRLRRNAGHQRAGHHPVVAAYLRY